MRVLVTGAAGFIGMHCAKRLLDRGEEVVGIDSLSSYTSVELKKDRLEQLPGLSFEQVDIADSVSLGNIFERRKPELVLHLAAQAGVRYSIENPQAYVQANLVGFANVLECCRRHPPRHLVYASSSSVYGANSRLPWSESDNVDRPVSFYAATKKANELMAHAYGEVHGLAATGLRYFTVYGPWGRPDMSPMIFATAIMEGRPIAVFNRGDMARDFTYIDDAVEATLRVLDKPAKSAVYNVGNHAPVKLTDYIGAMERALGRKATLEMKPMQPGDVKDTYADTRALATAVGFTPSTLLEAGLERFADWFKGYRR
ncbi:MAG TPA: NAD-dependent epimerase/dehydratase family protein [Burkholderiales bacterium]|nr:NAD-dependent epimerase/dehydratase family protein [Burkholderiales bacterium]